LSSALCSDHGTQQRQFKKLEQLVHVTLWSG
jgi:hypothetical protein